ncbi:MAG: alpha-amylase family glycosyl hydrolase, partial [Kiritimatiellales bacterium]
EINPKGFTSPNGPESGTFNSLKEKVPYLKSLGITGIWLAGHSLADSNHFYNIWTQYACIDPFKIDPSLGTPEEFKSLIDSCHQADIRVFLDVITHGVMNFSPLIKEHPTWFKGGSFKMTDYDWKAKNQELDAWWVNGWVDTVTRYGADGFRLDLGGKRYDLWKEIRRRSYEAGHPIVIFAESGDGIWLADRVPGVTDFCQKYLRVMNKPNVPFAPTNEACTDMAGLIHANYGPAFTKKFYGSIQISFHGPGWQGFPLDQNPYVVQDSRCLMGYAMFAPAIPIFMSGDEWNCGFRPLPTESPNLYGGSMPGKGRWLYGSWIDWSNFNQPARQAMLKDAKKIISIRKAYPDVLAAELISKVPGIASVPVENDSGTELPKPYIRWNSRRAILVAANPGKEDVSIRLKVPCNLLKWNCPEVSITDLWSGKPSVTCPVGNDSNLVIPVAIGPDRTPGGGLGIFLLEPVGGTASAAGTASEQDQSASAVLTNDVVVDEHFNNAIWSGEVDLNGESRILTFLNDQTITGLISDGGLTKAGAGCVTLSNANTYAFGTTVSDGTLIAAADGALGYGDVTVESRGKLILQAGTSNDCISNVSRLILNTNAVLVLDYTGFEIVGGISLDNGNSWLKRGTYTAAQLSARTGGKVTGTGSIKVVPPPAFIGMRVPLPVPRSWPARTAGTVQAPSRAATQEVS